MSTSHADIPTRPFGRTGIPVSILALGGWHLGLPRTEKEATRLVHAAIDGGITFMDNAWDYNEGVSETRMGKALAGRRDKVFLMTKVCVHGRDARTAMRQLEDSLRRLKTDYLDLWQIHEVIFDDEPRKKPKPHEIGQDLSLLSVAELGERIELLHDEIRRLEAELQAKGTTKSAAEALFRRG